jgi:hypothetical protein
MGGNVRPLILTGWTGDEWRPVADVTLPLMRAYADRHGCDFSWAELEGPRPPSWQKVIALLQTLPSRPAVVWIDADVVIEDGTTSILDNVPADADQALVEHLTGDGTVPNCGVWLVRPQMLDVLAAVWDCNRHVTHCWWEQAVMLERMGYVVDGNTARLDSPTTLYRRTAWLGAEWNDHPRDQRRAEHVRFRHVTQYANRLEAVRHFAAHATWTS